MDLGDARYVSFTTFRRNGDPVATPVWIAPLGDGRLGFTTDADSGKAKRLRANPDVELRECDVRGRVAAGAAHIRGQAALVTEGADLDATVAAVRKKYGLQFALIDLGGKLKRLIGRTQQPAAAVVITIT